MNTSRTVSIVVGGAALLILGGIILFMSRTEQPLPPVVNTPNTPAQTNTATQQPQPSAPVGQQQPIPKAPTKPGERVVISFTAPQGGAAWIIGEQHTISWTPSSGFNGGIALIDEQGATAGWINSNTDVRQTSFQWDTKTVFLSRGAPTKKDISAGTYRLKLVFDGGGVREVMGPTFSVVYKDQVKPLSYVISISNYAFSPNSISVPQGSLITFINTDSVKHRVAANTFGAFTIEAGTSTVMQTGSLTKGSHPYYCELHPSMQGTIIIQ